MSWIAGKKVLDNNSKETLQEMYAEIAEGVMRNTDLYEFPNMGQDIMPIKDVSNGQVFASQNEAKLFLHSLDWERKYNVIVPFKDVDAAKKTKAVLTLESRLEKEKQKLDEYKKVHAVKNFKANFVACPKCGSKINKEYIRDDDCCPLCWTSLQSETTKNTIKRYINNMNNLYEKIEEEKKKQSKKAPMKYLVMYEEYIG